MPNEQDRRKALKRAVFVADDSYIHTSKGGTMISGPDATRLYQAVVLRSSIKLHQACGMIPTRGVTITKMFALASTFSGKKYKRGQHDAAIADLTVWIETMKSALPITQED